MINDLNINNMGVLDQFIKGLRILSNTDDAVFAFKVCGN